MGGGGGVFELGNPEERRAEAVLDIQVEGGGGKKIVPSVVGVWIFSGITPLHEASCCFTHVCFKWRTSVYAWERVTNKFLKKAFNRQ